MSIVLRLTSTSRPSPLPLAGAGSQAALAAVILCGLISIAFVRSPFDGNGDTAWLMHAAARFLDGQALYTQVFETNPPLAILIYAPPVWMARSVGGAAQLWTHAWVIGIVALSLATVWRLCRRAGVRSRHARLALISALAFALLIMPSRMFAQREHIAAALLLVYLVASAATARRGRIGVGMTLLAALAGAAAMAIKPHFALVALGSHAALLARGLLRGSGEPGDRPACAKAWIAGLWRAGGAGLHAPVAALLVLGYGVASWALVPAYVTEMMPMLALVYAPHRLMSLPAMLASPHGGAFLLAFAAIAWLAWRTGQANPALVALAGGGFGGLVAFLVQGKGFPYHLIPGLVPLAGAAALALSAAAPRAPARLTAPVSVALAVVFAVVLPLQLDQHLRPRRLEAELRRLGDHRTMLLAAGDLGYAWPLVTRLGWTWTGRSMGMLIANVAAARLEATTDPAKVDALQREKEADIGRFIADALASRPDVMAFRTDEPEHLPGWTQRDPAFAAMLADYRPFAYADGVLALAKAGIATQRGR